LIKFGISGKSPYLTLVYCKGCFLKAHRLTLARLYRRELGRQSRVTSVESREYRVEVWMTFETKISKPFIVPI
jgi:hypothetical protein